MDKTIEELREEATVLGITFNANIGAEKLAAKIEEYYAAGESANKVVEKPVVVEPKAEHDTPQSQQAKYEVAQRKAVADARAAAMATKIVTVTSNDKRDNDMMTSEYVSCENQYFGIAKYVPFDIPVELEVCLIDVLKSSMITLHKDEIIDGRRTGNKIPMSVRKFNISYEDIKKA